MTQHDKATRNWRIACLFWFLLLTIATHVPQSAPTDNPTFESPDKLLHFVCFGILGFLFMCTGWIRNAILAWFLVAIWAYLDEVTQDMLPIGRNFSHEDLIAGELGILAAFTWQGALQSSTFQNLRSGIDRVLSSWKNWMCLGGLGAIVVLFTTGVLWVVIKGVTGEQQSEPAFSAGVIVGVIVMLRALVAIGNIQIDILKRNKDMVLLLFGTIGIPMMVGFAVPDTFVDPWVLALFASVLGSRVAWNTAT